MNYTEVLNRALRISWRYRYLWLLALFGGEYGSSGGNASFSQQTRTTSSTGSTSGSPFQPFADWFTGHIALLLAIGVAFAILGLIWFLIGCAASGGLVRAVAELDAGHPFGGRQAWGAGLSTFWRVLALRLLYLVISLVVGGVLIGTPLLLAFSHRPGSLLFLLLLFPFGLLFIAYAVFADVIFKLALRCLVLELLGAVAAIRAAIRLLGRRFGRVAIVWLILVGIGIGASIAVGIPTAIIFLALLGPISQGFASGNVNLVLNTLAIASAVGLVLFLVLAALLGTFWSACWTVAYRRFDLEPGAPPPPSLAG